MEPGRRIPRALYLAHYSHMRDANKRRVKQAAGEVKEQVKDTFKQEIHVS